MLVGFKIYQDKYCNDDQVFSMVKTQNLYALWTKAYIFGGLNNSFFLSFRNFLSVINDDWIQYNGKYEITFEINNTRYFYGISIDDRKVVEEWLHVFEDEELSTEIFYVENQETLQIIEDVSLYQDIVEFFNSIHITSDFIKIGNLQKIINTNKFTLMDTELPEKIWIVDIDANDTASIYSLCEFNNISNMENISERYKQGCFGGILPK